jgi:AcrR family transcriptional regulator
MRSTKGEQTRAAIAEAALRMFREQGYEATTMRAIAKEAGVATGNAYYYFDSKEELLGARHLTGVPEDLPAHRLDRAARRAPDSPGPGARTAVADPAAAAGRRRRTVLTRRLRPGLGASGRPDWVSASQPTRPNG